MEEPAPLSYLWQQRSQCPRARRGAPSALLPRLPGEVRHVALLQVQPACADLFRVLLLMGVSVSPQGQILEHMVLKLFLWAGRWEEGGLCINKVAGGNRRQDEDGLWRQAALGVDPCSGVLCVTRCRLHAWLPLPAQGHGHSAATTWSRGVARCMCTARAQREPG